MRQGQCVLILLDPSGILLPYFFFWMLFSLTSAPVCSVTLFRVWQLAVSFDVR